MLNAIRPVGPASVNNRMGARGAEPAGVSTEERDLMTRGLLPADYPRRVQVAATEGVEAAKAIARAGKNGPFTPSYGDPAAMLKGAKRIAANPELARMVADVRKGDVVCVAYNSAGDVIANATRGPFAHVLVCTQDGAPPEFIEAIGMTGDQRDPSNNMVRRSSALDHFGNGSSYRVIRPAAGNARAIDAAVAYCEKQLGKPYDYTFGENGVGRSFYCSSLAYYAYTEGAKLPIAMTKAPERDALILALDSMLDALAPKDRHVLMDAIARKVNAHPKPSPDELVRFVVEQVLPACETTRGLADTPRERAGLEAAIARFRSGQGLPRYDAAIKAGQGRLGVAWAFASDLYHAFDNTGSSKWQAIKAATKLAWGFLPYAEAVAGFLFGKDDGRTKLAGKLLDVTGRLHGYKLFGWLPVRGTNAIDKRFISPTDLAWADVPHRDYNLRPGQNLDGR